MKVGLLTSGGDCQGLNAALRGVAKTMYGLIPEVDLYGIQDGYRGLIEGLWHKMKPDDFSNILKQGGTILGTSRQPFKKMQELNENHTDKLSMMLHNYKKGGFDALVILGGNGTHKTAHLLSEKGLSIVTMPKTIDNDLFGTDLSFGFDSAVERAASVIDAIHTTAASHGRVFVIELMGHKAGWIALYAGMAGGADIILLPEIPYEVKNVVRELEKRDRSEKSFSIIAVAEGALTKEEAAISKKERQNSGESVGLRLTKVLQECLKKDVRATVPGHFQRGGDPTPADRILCSRLGAKAGELVRDKRFGRMAALHGNTIVSVPLEEIAGKLKTIPPDYGMLHQARLLGISFGEG
jgi:6-phosphofructokinase 1